MTAYTAFSIAWRGNNPLEKICISAMVVRFEPNFQALYVSINTTYSVNFSEMTDMVPQIQRIKF